MDYLVAPNTLYFKINDLLYIFNLQGQRELLSVQKCFSFIQFSQVKTGLTGSPTDSPNTFLFLHTPQTRHSLYAWLTHPIISNSPRQFPNNVSFIPFLYVCNLQSAIYVLVSLTVNSFSSFLPVCRPTSLSALSSSSGRIVFYVFNLPGSHCVCQAPCLYPQYLTATPVC